MSTISTARRDEVHGGVEALLQRVVAREEGLHVVQPRRKVVRRVQVDHQVVADVLLLHLLEEGAQVVLDVLPASSPIVPLRMRTEMRTPSSYASSIEQQLATEGGGTSSAGPNELLVHGLGKGVFGEGSLSLRSESNGGGGAAFFSTPGTTRDGTAARRPRLQRAWRARQSSAMCSPRVDARRAACVVCADECTTMVRAQRARVLRRDACLRGERRADAASRAPLGIRERRSLLLLPRPLERLCCQPGCGSPAAAAEEVTAHECERHRVVPGVPLHLPVRRVRRRRRRWASTCARRTRHTVVAGAVLVVGKAHPDGCRDPRRAGGGGERAQ